MGQKYADSKSKVRRGTYPPSVRRSYPIIGIEAWHRTQPCAPPSGMSEYLRSSQLRGWHHLFSASCRTVPAPCRGLAESDHPGDIFLCELKASDRVSIRLLSCPYHLYHPSIILSHPHIPPVVGSILSHSVHTTSNFVYTYHHNQEYI